MKIASNASPLIFLAKIERLDLLNMYHVILPKQAFEEIKKGTEMGKEDAQKIETLIDKKIIEMEEIDINKEIDKHNIGKGEKAAISLAIKNKMGIVLLDERKARRIAKFYKLKPKGTIGVLAEAYKNSKINKKEFKELIEKLIKEGYRIKETLILRLLDEINKA